MAKARIWVFDVEHGSMAFIRAPSGATLMIDCGRARDFSPALYVRSSELDAAERQAQFPITQLVVTHPHDDHIQDIGVVSTHLRPKIIQRNHYEWGEVEAESGGSYQNLQLWKNFQAGYNGPADPVDWGGMNISYWGLPPAQAKRLNESKFINNSSLITVIEYGGFKIVFPGDIEKDGWLELLEQSTAFRAALSRTYVFVTSHHGHSSGYVPEVYEAMGRPYFNLSSIHSRDENVESSYSSSDRAIGAQLNGETRYHMTTRQDGSCFLEIDEQGNWNFGFYQLAPNV